MEHSVEKIRKKMKLRYDWLYLWKGLYVGLKQPRRGGEQRRRHSSHKVYKEKHFYRMITGKVLRQWPKKKIKNTPKILKERRKIRT